MNNNEARYTAWVVLATIAAVTMMVTALLILTHSAPVHDAVFERPCPDCVFIGEYTERLWVDTTISGDLRSPRFFLVEESYTHHTTTPTDSTTAHAWASRYGYVIEW